MCLNLPQEVTDDVLSVLFQQYVSMLRLRHMPLTARISQVPRLPLRASRSFSNTECVRAESQDGIRDVRLPRSRVRCKRSLGRLHTQEGMGDVCFVYLALYRILCNLYLSTFPQMTATWVFARHLVDHMHEVLPRDAGARHLVLTDASHACPDQALTTSRLCSLIHTVLPFRNRTTNVP